MRFVTGILLLATLVAGGDKAEDGGAEDSKDD